MLLLLMHAHKVCDSQQSTTKHLPKRKKRNTTKTTTPHMIMKTSSFLRAVAAANRTKAFSTYATTGSARKVQKVAIDYIDEALLNKPNAQQMSFSTDKHRTNGETPQTTKPPPDYLNEAHNKVRAAAPRADTGAGTSYPRKMMKTAADYLDEARAKVQAMEASAGAK
jgi:hypothetical protein